jgi:undecaprenyl-diphosphatase
VETLLEWDYLSLLKINQIADGSMLSDLLIIIRNKYVWYPVYVFTVFYLWQGEARNKSFISILSLASLILFADVLNSQIVKPFVHRERPCNEISVNKHIIVRTYCSSSFSFPSSHAVNHFAFASFLSLLLGTKDRLFQIMLGASAMLVAIGQVHVGVHYPLDVIGGALLGIVLSRIWFRFIYLPSITRYSDSLQV